MAAKPTADIKPNGINQKDLVDLLYQIVASIQGICAKLDSDGGVPSETYTANCVTALLNCVLEDSKGNHLNLAKTETSTLEPTAVLKPTGVSDIALLALMYQITNAMETLTEQLDGDGLTFTNYEATAYTATFLHMVENMRGNTLGNSAGMADGTAFTFRPGGVTPQRELVDWLYNAVNAIYLLTADGTTTGLDGDETVTDTNYEALWYTANITLTVENTKGSRIGN